MNKADKAKKRHLNRTISWAARFNGKLVMLNGKIYYAMACMHKGEGALELRNGEEREKLLRWKTGMQARVATGGFLDQKGNSLSDFDSVLRAPLPVLPVRVATDGDIVIARLAGDLPSLPESFFASGGSCKALRRKIKFWRERKDGKSSDAI